MFFIQLNLFIKGLLILVSFSSYSQIKYIKEKKVRNVFEGLITTMMLFSLLSFVMDISTYFKLP